MISVIGCIGHDDLGSKPFDQRGGLRCIALLTCRQSEAHRTTQAYVFWCSGRRASGRSLDLQTPFFSPGSMLMGSDNGGIDDQIFEVRIIGDRLKDPITDALDAPTSKAPQHTVPVAKRFRKIGPRGAPTHDPKHALH